MLKRFFILIITAFFVVSTVMGQSDDSEMSIEQSYMQEALEMMIITELSRSDYRDQKMLALEHIGSAIERGNTNEELRTTLEALSLEGTLVRVTLNKRLANDYPEVRRQAAKYLGDIGTKEAESALIKICNADPEPMVLQEAVKSLGKIGLNEDGDALNTVVWVVDKYTNSDHPDPILAIAAIETLEKFAKSNKKVDPSTVQAISRIADGPYVKVVQDRARQAIINLRKYASQGYREQT